MAALAASLAALINPNLGGIAETATTPAAGMTDTTITATSTTIQPPAQPPGDLVEALNTFAVELYKALYLDKEGDTLYSPFSVYSALLITFEGMSGAARSEAAQALLLPGDNVLQDYKALLKALSPTQGNASLRIANALWVDTGFPLSEDYVERVRMLCGAEARNLDFAGDPEGSRRMINGWVENMTNGRIKDLLPPGSITPQTVVVITNAIHFKAPWLTPLPETLTATFRTEGGRGVEVEMMAGSIMVNL